MRTIVAPSARLGLIVGLVLGLTACGSDWPTWMPPETSGSGPAQRAPMPADASQTQEPTNPDPADAGPTTGAPQPPATSVAGGRGLLHRYSFTKDGTDAIAGAHATLFDGARVADGALQLDGVKAYASLPLAATIATLDSGTIEAWVSWAGPTNQTWARIFDFGGGTSSFMTLIAANGRAEEGSNLGTLRFSIATGGVKEQQVNALQPLPTGKLAYVAVTFDATDRVLTLYLDGQAVSVRAGTSLYPASLGNPANNWLGRSQFAADPFFNGSIVELRISGRALSISEVYANSLAGPDRVPVDP